MSKICYAIFFIIPKLLTLSIFFLSWEPSSSPRARKARHVILRSHIHPTNGNYLDDQIDLQEHDIYPMRGYLRKVWDETHDKSRSSILEIRGVYDTRDVGAVIGKLSLCLLSGCRGNGEAIANENSRGHHNNILFYHRPSRPHHRSGIVFISHRVGSNVH